MDEKELYKMDLHQIRTIRSNMRVIRVPGGWIYYGSDAGVFVPFNNEFMKGRN
jgi:hypothetical protein